MAMSFRQCGYENGGSGLRFMTIFVGAVLMSLLELYMGRTLLSTKRSTRTFLLLR